MPGKGSSSENLECIACGRDRKRFYLCLDSIRTEKLDHGNQKSLIPVFH